MQLKFGNRVIKTCRLLKEHIFLYILQFLVLLFVLAMQCVQESLTFIPVPFASEALNIDVRVVRGRQLLYTATTWAGYIGILTAQRPGAYAAAVNFREPGGERAAVAENALPVGLALRLALERNEGYGDFVEAHGKHKTAG